MFSVFGGSHFDYQFKVLETIYDKSRQPSLHKQVEWVLAWSVYKYMCTPFLVSVHSILISWSSSNEKGMKIGQIKEFIFFFYFCITIYYGSSSIFFFFYFFLSYFCNMSVFIALTKFYTCNNIFKTLIFWVLENNTNHKWTFHFGSMLLTGDCRPMFWKLH